jgi:hypothetical protein
MYARKMVLNEFLSWRRLSWRLIPAGDHDLTDGSAPDHATGYAEHDAMLAEVAKLPRCRDAADSGIRLLNTRAGGTSLIGDSRLVVHDDLSPRSGGSGKFDQTEGVLTADGQKIVTCQELDAMTFRPHEISDEFGEYSTATGRLIRILWPRGHWRVPRVDQFLRQRPRGAGPDHQRQEVRRSPCLRRVERPSVRPYS